MISADVHPPSELRPETFFVSVKGLNIRVYDSRVSSESLPLLILNGLGQAIEMLQPLMEKFPDRRLITFDVAGIGKSEISPVPQSIFDHAEVVADLLSSLGVSQVDILGISWGGSVAQQFVYNNPDRCRRMILAITSAGGIGSWVGSPIALSEVFFPMRYFNKEWNNFIGPLMYGGEAIENRKLFAEYSKRAIIPSLAGYYSQVAAMCSWTSVHWLHQLKHNALILAGSKDTLIPVQNQILLASLIPNSELRVFDTGHLLMYSLRDIVSEYIEGFLVRE